MEQKKVILPYAENIFTPNLKNSFDFRQCKLPPECTRTLNNERFSVGELFFDSRKIDNGPASIFVAINSGTRNGHQYIADAYKKGCRMFVVSESELVPNDANYIMCDNTLNWLQFEASERRKEFTFPILAITGSNGKTVIKEWLLELINPTKRISYSPKSYNSQLGVAMSLLTTNTEAEFGLFEAGISLPGEMTNLENMLLPQMGILSNIGSSHLENFRDKKHLLQEKIKLFSGAQWLICSEDFYLQNKHLLAAQLPKCKIFTWGSVAADIHIDFKNGSAAFGTKTIQFTTPKLSNTWLENLGHCIAFGLLNQLCDDYFCNQIQRLKSIENRLALHNTFGSNFILNDAYSLDINSLYETLNYFQFQAKAEKQLLLLSEFDSGNVNLHSDAIDLISQHAFHQIILLGEKWNTLTRSLPKNAVVIKSKAEATNLCTQYIATHSMLIKGARKWQIESVVDDLLKLCNRSYLAINLAAIKRNVQKLKQNQNTDTKLLAMLKAEAYGSGLQRIGKSLQNAGADYLGVAFTQEAIALREAGVRLPILVVHPFEEDIEMALRYNLELSAYSTPLLYSWYNYLKREQKTLPIHLEIETGMHRQGLSLEELDSLPKEFKEHFLIKGTFSHLAEGKDASSQRTKNQITQFDLGLAKLAKAGWDIGITHLLNTDGITNHLSHTYDMVRSGIGLFGMFPGGEFALNLSSKISKVTAVKKGQFIGYGNQFSLKKDSHIALVPLGYADGLPYTVNPDQFHVKIKGKNYPLAGAICMDMMLINLGSDIAEVGDTVDIIYDTQSLENICTASQTIPYEILSRFSQRIGRIFIDE